MHNTLYVDQELRTLGVGASKNVFKGALVGLSSAGYAQPLVAGDPFVGIAYEQADNSGGANAAIAAHVGRPVFASADDTLTFIGAGNSYVGTVQEVPASGEIVLRIDPQRAKIKTVTHSVEDLAAGADIAARAVHSFDAPAWLVSARAVNQATSAAGIDNANTCVVAIATDAGSVVSATFNATNTFPAANAKKDLGALANTFAAAGSVMTLAVTNGATANPGPFLVEVDYV